MTTEKISLGEKLKISKQRSDAEKLRIENERKMKEDKREREKFEEIALFFENAKKELIEKIEKDYDRVFVCTKGHKRNYEWFNVQGNRLRYIERDPILKMAYDTFVTWLDENGLKVIPIYDNDGMESWTNFSIQPKD